MRDLTANKKLTAEERVNSISGLQIQFDLYKKETWYLSGAILYLVAIDAPPAARLLQPEVIAGKGIEPDIDPKKAAKQYEDILEVKDISLLLSPQMAKVICWNVHGLYQQKAHWLLKKIMEIADIFTHNYNGTAVVYRDLMLGSNFKLLFKSMLSNQQNLN